MHPTRNTLSENIRAQSVELLNKHLAAAIDLHAQVKQAHWNVHGPGFIAIHELFDKVSDHVEDISDLIAERARGLGGTAYGTIQVAAERSFLVPYSLGVADEASHVFAVSGTLAAFGQSVRDAIDLSAGFGDAGTADLFTQISRDVDHQLWFVEIASRRQSGPSLNRALRPSLRQLRVMVVEDDPVIALLLGEVLAASGHKVCAIVHDETTAVATAGTCLPDLLIVDVQLGAGCGVAAVTAITRTQAVPHLFVTGNPAAVLARRPGAVVVQKPFFGVDLCLAIDRALAVPVTIVTPPPVAPPEPAEPPAPSATGDRLAAWWRRWAGAPLVSPWDGVEPIRGELLSLERLQEKARVMAGLAACQQPPDAWPEADGASG